MLYSCSSPHEGTNEVLTDCLHDGVPRRHILLACFLVVLSFILCHHHESVRLSVVYTSTGLGGAYIRSWCTSITCGRVRSCINPIKHHMPDPTLFHIHLKASIFRCNSIARYSLKSFDLLRFHDEVLAAPSNSSKYSGIKSSHLRWGNMLSPRQRKECLP